MNKTLLVLTIMSAGAGGYLAALRATSHLQDAANTTRDACSVQTQLVAIAQMDLAGLAERIDGIKHVLNQPQAVAESPLWAAVQADGGSRLTPELRERLFEEIGLSWKSSDEFILVSKGAVREVQMRAIQGGELTENAAMVLAVTPKERGEIEAAMHRAEAELDQWALYHTERIEPKDDVVAQYTLQSDPAMSVSNNLSASLLKAVGPQRAELMSHSAREWVRTIGVLTGSRTMIVRRSVAENGLRLTFQMVYVNVTREPHVDNPPQDISECPFPRVFLPAFPNGWADVAKREGFELPRELQEQ
jgi:hypothetical protein